MSIKYCYNHEIHKTLNIPTDYSSLVKDFTSLFVQKLPSKFIVQYQDADGDKIAITNDHEYQALIKQELPTALSSVKLYITSLTAPRISQGRRSTCTPKSEQRSDSNGSFEVVESETSLRMEEIVDPQDPIPLEDQDEDDLESRVVISLQIPSGNVSRQEEKGAEDSEPAEEEQKQSFSGSANAKSRTSESRDLVQEMSLSMVEDKSVGDGESCASKASFNQAFQNEEENLSRSEESPREEIQENAVEERNMVTLEIPDFKEKDSRDLSEYLTKITKRKSIEKNSPKIEKLERVFCNSASEAGNDDDKDDQSKEESPERWVSFDSHHDATPTGQDVELQGRSLFTLKQKPEAWFICNQDRSNRYRESEGSEGEELNCSRSFRRSPQCSSRNNNNNSNNKRDFGQQVDGLSEDQDTEARKGLYRELKVKHVKSEQPSAEVSFRENTNDLLHDIWYDLQRSPRIQSDKGLHISIHEYRELKSPAEEEEEEDEQESPREALETMNISLLTASEAKRIASAIGSINRIDAVKKLKIFPEPDSPVEPAIQEKPVSPAYNKWACRRSDIQLPEEDWPFLRQCEIACKKDTFNLAESKVHEGSFCMGCWQSPIRGARFVCLICDDIEYCETCEAKINHCHPLLKIKEPTGTLQDFMENICAKFVKKSEPVFTPREELSFKEGSVYKDAEELERSLERPFELEMYPSSEELAEDYKFEYKEISSTPLMIRSNKKEWCIVYKTICLRNTGNSVWRRCHFEPVGLVPGTITEVTYISPGDSVLVTLEIHGFFAPGKYNSTWRVVHQGELNVLNEMGYIDLEFEVVENKANFFSGQSLYEREPEEDEFFDY